MGLQMVRATRRLGSRAGVGLALVMMLGGVAVGGCGDSSSSGAEASDPTDVASQPRLVTGNTDMPATFRANRAAAAAESARVVGLVPVPPGATRLAAAPDSWSGPSQITLGPSENRLTRTAWWTVPVGANAMQHVLLSQTPVGMRREGGVGGGSDGIRFVTYGQTAPAAPDAYFGVSLLVQWSPTRTEHGELLVRADTFTAARAVRNPRSTITGTVRAVDIRQIRAIDNGQSRRMRPVHLEQSADVALIEHLVRAVNQLPASTRPVPVASCPAPPRPTPRLDLTFHTGANGADEVTMKLVDWCFGQVQSAVNGHEIRPTLDPGRLVTTVNHLLARRVHQEG